MEFHLQASVMINSWSVLPLLAPHWLLGSRGHFIPTYWVSYRKDQHCLWKYIHLLFKWSKIWDIFRELRQGWNCISLMKTFIRQLICVYCIYHRCVCNSLDKLKEGPFRRVCYNFQSAVEIKNLILQNTIIIIIQNYTQRMHFPRGKVRAGWFSFPFAQLRG